jgi:hypothetical protein
VASAQGPELSAALDLERCRPWQPGRTELDAQASRGLSGQLGVLRGPKGQLGGPMFDLLRRQCLPGQAELHGSQA